MFKEINSWIQNGCSYQEGVGLYDRYGTDTFFKRLLLRGESDHIAQKLNERLVAMLDELPAAPALAEVDPSSPAPEVLELTGFSEFDNNKTDEAKTPVLLQVTKQRDQTYVEIRSLHPYLSTLPEGPELKDLAKRMVRLGKQNANLWERYNNITEGREDPNPAAAPPPPPVMVDMNLIIKREAIRKSLNKAENRIKGIAKPKANTLALIDQRRLELAEIDARILEFIKGAKP